MQLLKKLGAKQILGNIKEVVLEYCLNDKDIVKVYAIYGMANGIKTGTSTYGEWTMFVGQMEAINYVTGESFAAVGCFIPEPLQTILLNALNENDKIEFAFEVSVKRRDDLKEGYEYMVEPKRDVTEADPLDALRKLIKPKFLEPPKAKALPKSKAKPKTETVASE